MISQTGFMLQETNKFRDRCEILIEVLDKQLEERSKVLKELHEGISKLMVCWSTPSRKLI
jgi:signal transduction histidine kinase